MGSSESRSAAGARLHHRRRNREKLNADRGENVEGLFEALPSRRGTQADPDGIVRALWTDREDGAGADQHPSPACLFREVVRRTTVGQGPPDVRTRRGRRAQTERLGRVPESVWEQAELETLVLADNKLSEVSEQIGRLKRLRVLDLGHNELTRLPDALADLDGLTDFLYLHDNRLTSLPSSLERLTKLRYLNISENAFAVLPECISGMASLIELRASDNQSDVAPRFGRASVTLARVAPQKQPADDPARVDGEAAGTAADRSARQPADALAQGYRRTTSTRQARPAVGDASTPRVDRHPRSTRLRSLPLMRSVTTEPTLPSAPSDPAPGAPPRPLPACPGSRPSRHPDRPGGLPA